MRLLFFILFILVVNSFACAQFVFDSTNTSPIAGDSYIEYNADTLGINPGPSGANQTWSFPTLNIDTNTRVSHFFMTPVFNSSCSASNFTAANVEDSIYRYQYSLSAQSFLYISNYARLMIGEVNGCCRVYSNDTLMIFPFSFGNHYKNQFSYVDGGCLNSHSETLSRSYDGYGTLSLPGITYNNVARIIDSVKYAAPTGLGHYSKGFICTYKWYENGIKPTVLTIVIQDDSSFQHYGTSSQTSSHSISKTVVVSSYNGIGINYLSNNNSGLTIFPNPSTDKITLQSQTEIGAITISNFIGETVYRSQITNRKAEIDITDFPKGVYILRTGERTYKLIKE